MLLSKCLLANNVSQECFSFFSFFSFLTHIYIQSFHNKEFSLGRFPSFSQACSVPRRVYLVIPQAGTRCRRACSVPRRVDLLHPFSIRGSDPKGPFPIDIRQINLPMKEWWGSSSENHATGWDGIWVGELIIVKLVIFLLFFLFS
jgi:hypothetical protein